MSEVMLLETINITELVSLMYDNVRMKFMHRYINLLCAIFS